MNHFETWQVKFIFEEKILFVIFLIEIYKYGVGFYIF